MPSQLTLHMCHLAVQVGDLSLDGTETSHCFVDTFAHAFLPLAKRAPHDFPGSPLPWAWD
jgi:hypothetical protein